jgi:short-subunit dehydrogenase
VRYLPLNLKEEKSILNLTRQAAPVDILINNAGQSQLGPAEEITPAKYRELFEVNFFGLISLTNSLLPQMRERRQGRIINIGSLAASFPVPFQSSYVASKSALAGFSHSLRGEMVKWNVQVVLVEPNDIRTAIQPEMLASPGSKYGVMVKKMKSARDKNMAKSQSPDIVARKILSILNRENPAPFYACGGMAPLLVFLKRFLPGSLVEGLVRKNYNL